MCEYVFGRDAPRYCQKVLGYAALWRVLLCAGILVFSVMTQGAAFVCRAHAMEVPEAENPWIFTNPDTGYEAVVEDDAELLTQEQRQWLLEEMEDITAYGNAAFKSIDRNASDTEDYAGSFYRSLFGTESGVLFLIDMDNRNIWIHSDGAVYRTVTAAYAETVTDNVYRYASREEYYECASEAYREIYALLEGERIAQPMKYISNALLAMILALLLNFGLVVYFTRLRKPGTNEILNHMERKFTYTRPNAVYTHQTKLYSPVSSDSGGGSSGGGGGGGGGGSSSGGSSGGGGGHSF